MGDYFTAEGHDKEFPKLVSSPESTTVVDNVRAGYVSPPGGTPTPVLQGSVIKDGVEPCPEAQYRFLHGGPPLSTLSAPSVMAPISSAFTGVQTASASWRAFTDDEEADLAVAWEKVPEGRRGISKNVSTGHTKLKAGGTAVDPTLDQLDHVVPVGLDKLFSVDLESMTLAPDFWEGAPIRVIRTLWYYPPTATAGTASHNIKVFPVDGVLANALEEAYQDVQPWTEAYEDELKAALKSGADAEGKLRMPLVMRSARRRRKSAAGHGRSDSVASHRSRRSASVNSAISSGDETEQEEATRSPSKPRGRRSSGGGSTAQMSVIFQSDTSARVYSGVMSQMGKSVFSSGKGHGGGQVVLRGWEAVQAYGSKKASKPSPAPTTKEKAKEVDKVARGSGTSTPVRAATSSSADPGASTREGDAGVNPSPAANSSGWFASLRLKLTVLGTASTFTSATGVNEEEATEDDEGNTTKEAFTGVRNKQKTNVSDNDDGVGEVDELVLVIHGIGQKLTATYEGFSFVHAVNQLRTGCTSLSTSPSLAPLIHSKRAQFIPVQWRTDLSFEHDLDDDEGRPGEELSNRFSLDDIEIKDSIPLIRQVVSGLVLDVPFYLSHHRQKMIRAVVLNANRIYRLFCARNPGFAEKGRVSIVAHSLGSVLSADILSAQPTFVKPLSQMTREELLTEKEFVFDTRLLFAVGSPLAFFLHLNKGQLIARKGRARTDQAGKDIALVRAGRYGCLAIDGLYNVYNVTDPVAFQLNATVDCEYAKMIKPIAIPSVNQTLLMNIADTYQRVTSLFDMSSLWSSDAKGSVIAEEVEDKALKEKADAEKDSSAVQKPASRPPPVRPRQKRMPSERPMQPEQFVTVNRAEKRFKALNPQGGIDFFLPQEGLNAYVESLSSHGAYWYDARFATFLLTQMFSSQDDLERTGREHIAEE